MSAIIQQDVQKSDENKKSTDKQEAMDIEDDNIETSDKKKDRNDRKRRSRSRCLS